MTNLDQAIHKDNISQLVELSSLSFSVSSPITQFLPHVSTSSISSTISTTSPSTSKTVMQIIIISSTSAPLTGSSIFHSHIPVMVARYSPMVLPPQLHNMPQDYQSRIPQFDGIGSITAQQHPNKMNDYFDLQEVDEEDVKLRIFSQTLNG